MDIFDLLFIAVFVAVFVALVTAGVAAIRGRRASALRILMSVAGGAAIYIAIVCVVSVGTQQRVLSIGDPQCNDDWCIAVDGVQRTAANSGNTYTVTLRLSSRARRIAQRENGVRVYLTDAQGRQYDPTLRGDETPFNILLQPGESETTVRVFNLPADARDIGLVVAHDDSVLGCFPGCFVITENNWFHKPTIVRLD